MTVFYFLTNILTRNKWHTLKISLGKCLQIISPRITKTPKLYTQCEHKKTLKIGRRKQSRDWDMTEFSFCLWCARIWAEMTAAWHLRAEIHQRKMQINHCFFFITSFSPINSILQALSHQEQHFPFAVLCHYSICGFKQHRLTFCDSWRLEDWGPSLYNRGSQPLGQGPVQDCISDTYIILQLATLQLWNSNGTMF